MTSNPVLDAIRKRRSIRHYIKQSIPDDRVHDILEAGRWAPSGLNNQPWRFVIIKNQSILETLSTMTHYTSIIKSSDTCLAVFFHLPSGYNRDKDMMGIGACIQNMLLAAHSLGIGAVWLGEILNKKENVRSLLEVSDDNELVAVIALGYSNENPAGKRIEPSRLLLKIL